ncbi:DNA polymerase III subunit chi [Silicimonas sp. MF1-12-2]|uniref:DNA polymerase III subunit chi n=1 Tax=Silicimonas sp. MF1-12-2 TaxID=3384793 RepID=UPI0039B67D5C
MGAVLFYHLTERPLERTLPVLLSKALDAGWKVIVRGRDQDLIERLDRQLWSGDGFLPHGIAGGEHDAMQPVLLTTGSDCPNDASCIMSVGGADLTPEEILAVERACILFDGADPSAVELARNQWKSLIAGGVSAQYWAEDGGRWVKKAESSGA